MKQVYLRLIQGLLRSAFALAVSLLPVESLALEYQKLHTFEVAEEDVLQEEHWIIANSGIVHGRLEQDLFISSDELQLTGVFEKDLWALAGTLEFSGTVNESLRAVGDQLKLVQGSIDSTLTAMGVSINVSEELQVTRDAVLIGEDVIVQGRIDGNILILAKRATLKGQVGGNARIIAEDIEILSGAKIAGDLVYSSSEELILSPAVELGGELKKKAFAGFRLPRPTPQQIATRQILFCVAAFIASLPLFVLFPNYVSRCLRLARGDVWKCSMAGLVGFCLMPMLGFFAFLSLIGIPLSLVIFCVYATLVYLSKPIVALALGSMLFKASTQGPIRRIFSTLFIGLVLLYILFAIPIVGGTMWFLASIIGLGAMLLSLFGHDLLKPTDPSTQEEQKTENALEHSANDTRIDEP